MSVTERPSYTKSSFQIPPPSENVLLAVVAAAFLVLHIAAGVILINASARPRQRRKRQRPL
jgi:hypothetical protein